MASRAILRRRRSFIHNYLNGSTSSILSLHSSARAIGTQSPSPSNCSNGISPYKDDSFKLSPDLRQYVYRFASSGLRDGFSRSNAPIGVRWLSSQSAAAAAKSVGPENEGNDEVVAKKRKEASPEECDQAVEGLTTAKAKAKAKRSQESPRDVQSVLRRVWNMFLGIGPALRAVASMSRSDSFTLIPLLLNHKRYLFLFAIAMQL